MPSVEMRPLRIMGGLGAGQSHTTAICQGGPSHPVAGSKVHGGSVRPLFLPLSPFAKRPFWALSPGGGVCMCGGGSPTQTEAVLIANLFVRSRGEDPQAPATLCPFCSEESHRLHSVVRHPDHHTHQVRSTCSVTEASLPPKAPACQPSGPLLEALGLYSKQSRAVLLRFMVEVLVLCGICSQRSRPRV